MQTAAQPQMFSLDFSDTMRSHSTDELVVGGVAQNPAGPSNAGDMEAIAAVLQLFDLCPRLEDSIISAEDLAKVLRSHLGGEAEVERILGLLSDDSNGLPPNRFNFLNYWQGMDRFFQEASGVAPQTPNSPDAEERIGTIEGMRRFRDGVLTMARVNGLLSEDAMSSLHLLDLLKKIRANASDPDYWEEVMQAVPAEEGYGLTLTEVAEAVYLWLGDFLKGEVDGGAGGTEPEGTGTMSFADLTNASPEPCDDASNPEMEIACSMSFADVPLGATPKPKTKREPVRKSVVDGLGALGREMQRAHELHDLILQRTPEENSMVHQALDHLAVVHDTVFSALLARQREIDDLKHEVLTTAEKKEAAEVELTRTGQYAGELDGRFANVERQRDESVRKVVGLEDQVKALTRQCEDLEHSLNKTQAYDEDHKRELAAGAQQSMRIEGRMAQLERDADSAEGRAQWMRTKLQTVQARMVIASRAVQSYAGCAEEGEEAAALLHKKLLESGSLDGTQGGATSAATEEMEKQLKLQQAQLQRLRQVRDDLLKAHDSWASKTPDDGSCNSPRELQVHRRCTFLAAQLQALLQHATELEVFLDNGQGNGGDAEQKRQLSVKRIAEDARKNFSEFSEKLHTLEVQKADVDGELRRLQQRFAEQEGQMRAVQRHRDQLLVEAGSAAGGKAEFVKRADTGDASSSTASGPANHGLSGGFLFDGARPASGELRSSPKAPAMDKLKKTIAKVVHIQHLTGRAESPGGLRPTPLVFDMTANANTQYVESGQRRRSAEARQRSETRQKEDKGTRREHKDKETRHHKEDKDRDRDKDKDKLREHVRGKMKGGKTEGGNCDTQ